MIRIENISKEYADKLLFKTFSTVIFDGDKIGIVGANGCGKTTLMSIIAGEQKADSGVVVNDKLNVGYLKQVSNYFVEDFTPILQDQEFAKNFNKIKSLLGLKDDFALTSQPFAHLSFGEKTKLMLATILCKNPDVLLLDEPTNHLDQDGINWLIKTINNLEATVIIISHDRYFLNSVVNKIYEIENGHITEFDGNYDCYEFQKHANLEREKKVYYEKVEENKRIEKQVEHLKQCTNKLVKATKRDGSADRRGKGYKNSVQMKVKKLASQVGAKTKRLEKMKNELGDKPFEQREIFYALKADEFANKTLIKGQNVSKRFENKVILQNANFEICSHDKVALLGSNGCGKTTLLRMILGQDTNFEGEIWKTKSLKVAYLTQDVLDLDESSSILEIAKQKDKQFATQFLSNIVNMGLSKQTFDRKIGTLSLGERMRIKLCEIVLSDYNLLVLDEPTNHLDLPNRVFLQEVLEKFNGAFILVSHDKFLVEKVCSKHIKFENKTLVVS